MTGPLLSPATRARIATLRWTLGATATEGLGERRGQGVGIGLEFAALRPFRMGDDARSIDARASARAGRPVVRENAAERRLSVTLICDTSASMAVAKDRPAQARVLTALLAALTLTDGARLTLICGDKSQTFAGADKIDDMLYWLERLKPNAIPFAISLKRYGSAISGAGAVMMVSDWQDPAALSDLRPLLRKGPLLAFRLGDPRDDIPALGPATLVDAETADEMTIDVTPALQAAYIAARDAQIAALQKLARAQDGGLLTLLPDTDTIVETLRQLHQYGLISD